MGVMPRFFSSSSYDNVSSTNLIGNPNPNNYKILRYIRVGIYILIKIKYPDSLNYEGNKILLYKSTLDKLNKQKCLDPHFSDNSKFISPIARFEPTHFGWELGKKTAYYLRSIKKY